MDMQKLIFANLLNGVPEQQVAATFKISPEEVQRTFMDVLRKVKSYCFKRNRGCVETIPGTDTKVLRAMPMIAASTLEEAKKFRVPCLAALPHIRLDKADVYKDIQHETVTPDNAMQIARNLA